MIRWCAIGDSFTYLNDHPDETNHYVTKGYLSRTLDSLRAHRAGRGADQHRHQRLDHAGLADRAARSGGLLHHPARHERLAQRHSARHGRGFFRRAPGTILGNLSHLIGRIRALSPEAKLLVMNPIERTDFVYLFDPFNNAPGSYAPEHGQKSPMWRRRFMSPARVIKSGAGSAQLCGVTPENAVRFKRVRTPEGIRDLPWPEYVGLPFDPVSDPYPYPPEAHFFDLRRSAPHRQWQRDPRHTSFRRNALRTAPLIFV